MMVFFSLVLSFFLGISAQAEPYKVALKKGRVEITRKGQPVTGEVISGDEVKVFKASILILKNSKETLKIMQDTVITPLESNGGSIIKLAKGSLVSWVQKKEFKVKTKSTVLGVRGTKFFVQATGESDLWMCVQEGVVNVETRGVKKAVDVPAGKGVFVGEKEISTPKAYAWTKGINWNMNPRDGKLDHKIKLNYDVLNNFYD